MGPTEEGELIELVELLVEADVPGRQMKVADVVAASVVVVVCVGTYDLRNWLTVAWVRDGEVTCRGADYGSESTDFQ